MGRTVLLTHTDLDGVGCEVILRKYLESDTVAMEGLQVYREDYNTADARMREILAGNPTDIDHLFITDISVKEPETITLLATFADQYPGVVTLLDHHETVYDRLGKYSWYTYGKICGTMMFYNHLSGLWGKHDNDQMLYDFAVIVDDYDRWIKQYPGSDMMNQLFFFMGADAFIQRCMKKDALGFLTAGEAIHKLTIMGPLTGRFADCMELIALIEQQAEIIEKLKLCWNCNFAEADRCNKHNCLIDYPMREKCDKWQVKEGQAE